MSLIRGTFEIGGNLSRIVRVLSTILFFANAFVGEAATPSEDTNKSRLLIEQSLVRSGFIGTTSVEFSEVAREGELEGCSLVYKAVFPDVVYRSGQPTIAVGNITFNNIGNKFIGLSFKIGIRPLVDETTAPFEPPNFAYIITSNGSSAKMKQVANELDDGFKFFAYPLDDPAFAGLFEGLISDEEITIAFNRAEKSVDQRFKLDLAVDDSEMKDGKIVRARTKKSLSQFIECSGVLIDRGS